MLQLFLHFFSISFFSPFFPLFFLFILFGTKLCVLSDSCSLCLLFTFLVTFTLEKTLCTRSYCNTVRSYVIYKRKKIINNLHFYQYKIKLRNSLATQYVIEVNKNEWTKATYIYHLKYICIWYKVKRKTDH